MDYVLKFIMGSAIQDYYTKTVTLIKKHLTETVEELTESLIKLYLKMVWIGCIQTVQQQHQRGARLEKSFRKPFTGI